MKLYKVPETSLQMYMPSEKFAGKRNLDNEPCEEYRIRDKEVATVEEYEAEKKRRMEKDDEQFESYVSFNLSKMQSADPE